MDDVSMLGDSGYAREDRDFYPTPPECTGALLKALYESRILASSAPHRMTVWEPACGDGAMVDVLSKHFCTVIATDIMPLMEGGHVANFLTTTPKASFDAIITNPPYGDMVDEFMIRAHHHLRAGRCDLVAFLCRKELDSAVTRRKFFKESPFFSAKIDLLWRPRWIKGSKGSPRHNYSWYVWEKAETVALAGGAKLLYAERGQ